MHIDMPRRTDIERISAARDPLSISIFAPTTPLPTHAEENRLRVKTLFSTALKSVNEIADVRTSRQIVEHVEALLEDTDFWRTLGRSLAIFITPSGITEYRLPNELTEYVSVADRFTITPLLRAVTFPHAALVLAISQNGARLVGVNADAPAETIDVPELPQQGAEDALGVPSVGARSHHGRLHGDEGRTVRLTQYARAVDHSLRPTFNGTSLPLILAATEPLLSIYRNLCGYDGLLADAIRGNPDESSDAELAAAARGILDDLYAKQLRELKELFSDRSNSGRATTDLSDLARAASFGALNTLAVQMDAEVHGTVDDTGVLHLDESDHDALEEIARRAISTGARVLAVRASDLPDGVVAAGILRFAV
ncbi:MAG: hypothetical protein L0G23_04325 [Ruaniaceae bacterium]|nr:hypothetical protein [Ruaniaceae bacterium]